MKKIGTIVGGGVAAIALAAAVGFSGIFSGQALAGEAGDIAAASGYKSNLPKDESRGMKFVPSEAGLTAAQAKALMAEIETGMKAAIADLVSKGTITQETADALLPADAGAASKNGKTGHGTDKAPLTEEQMSAIGTAMQNANNAAIDKLLSTGIITSEQADILKKEKGGIGFRHAGRPGGSMLTAEQSEQLNSAVAELMKSALDDQVKTGIFTQAEADSLISMLPAQKDKQNGSEAPKEPAVRPKMTEAQAKAFKDALSKAQETAVSTLVANGVLTQETADKLKDCGPMSKMDSRGLIGGKGVLAGLTDAQRERVTAAMQSAAKTALEELVNKGTITAEMAEAITPKLPPEAPESGKPSDADRNGAAGPEITKEQMDAIKAALSETTKAALTELVKDGTITQETADALGNGPMMGGRGMHGKGMGGHHGFGAPPEAPATPASE